jgi:hypothetical protein
VTVHDLIGEAVAKKTFYVHFDGLAELQAAVADQLAHEFDELLQPRRLATEDPVERSAAGCGAFVGDALSNPAWGALVARAGSYPCRTSRLARGGARSTTSPEEDEMTATQLRYRRLGERSP